MIGLGIQRPATTIADVLYYLLFTSDELNKGLSKEELDEKFEDRLRSVAMWPPDVFCVAAALLKQSNAYTRPRDTLPRGLQAERLETDAANWLACIAQNEVYPPVLEKLLKLSVQESDLKSLSQADNKQKDGLRRRERPINSTTGDDDRIKDLLDLLIIADHASSGFGLHHNSADECRAWVVSARYRADTLIEPGIDGSTLCINIAPSKARVLPKTHTPARGFSMRAFSHNLAFVDTDQGSPLWFTIPGLRPNLSSLNILLVPYPFCIPDSSFSVDEDFGPKHSYFRYIPEDSFGGCVTEIERLCDSAEASSGRRVDIVVLPELALNVKDYRLLQASMRERGILVICGVGDKTQEGRVENRICVDIPLGDGYSVHLRQKKHHHWQLDSSQILQYKLAGVFDPTRRYWERLQIGDRQLCFLALHQHVLASVLLCEDLAQYEPVGKLVRAVGPNLVIALLMDAPQIKERWPFRYASVLADDPGSSVLTLTCLGMSLRSKRENESDKDDKTRIIGLWKDPLEEPRELKLAPDSRAILLTITMDERDEWTIDLRKRTAYVPKLSGVHQIVENPLCNSSTPNTSPGKLRALLAPGDATALSRLIWLESLCRSPKSQSPVGRSTSGQPPAKIAAPSAQAQLAVKSSIDPAGTREEVSIEEFFVRNCPEIRARMSERAREIADCIVPEFLDDENNEYSEGSSSNFDDTSTAWQLQGIQRAALRFLNQDSPHEFDETRRKTQLLEYLKRWLGTK